MKKLALILLSVILCAALLTLVSCDKNAAGAGEETKKDAEKSTEEITEMLPDTEPVVTEEETSDTTLPETEPETDSPAQEDTEPVVTVPATEWQEAVEEPDEDPAGTITSGLLNDLGLTMDVGAWRDYMPTSFDPDNPPPENYNCLFVVSFERTAPAEEEIPVFNVSATINGHEYILERDVTGLKDYSTYRISMEDRKYLGDGYLPGVEIGIRLKLTLGTETEVIDMTRVISRTD